MPAAILAMNLLEQRFRGLQAVMAVEAEIGTTAVILAAVPSSRAGLCGLKSWQGGPCQALGRGIC